MLSTLWVTSEWWKVKEDTNKDFYVHFSLEHDIGEIIRVMKAPEDKLMVIPDLWLVYWQADIPHATRQLNYYPFNATTPLLSKEVESLLKDTPPTFWYADCVMGCFGLERYFPEYIRIKRHGSLSHLYVKDYRIKSLTPEQQQKLQEIGVSL